MSTRQVSTQAGGRVGEHHAGHQGALRKKLPKRDTGVGLGGTGSRPMSEWMRESCLAGTLKAKEEKNTVLTLGSSQLGKSEHSGKLEKDDSGRGSRAERHC